MALKMYEASEKDKKNIEKNFTYHAPSYELGQPEKYETIRAEAKKFAELLTTLCPPSRELSVALTELETSVFWAIAAIARNESLNGNQT